MPSGWSLLVSLSPGVVFLGPWLRNGEEEEEVDGSDGADGDTASYCIDSYDYEYHCLFEV
jgi:hypothetical protein